MQLALRQLIPVRNFPRALIQITLQVVETPDNAYTNTKVAQAQLVSPQFYAIICASRLPGIVQNLPIIPALLHAAILGLLNGAVPLKTMATATIVAIPEGEDDGIIVDPTIVEVDRAKSVHVLGFTSDKELLLTESEGSFSVDQWTKVLETAQHICCESQGSGLDTAMGDGGIESQSIKDFIRATMETKVAADLHWK